MANFLSGTLQTVLSLVLCLSFHRSLPKKLSVLNGEVWSKTSNWETPPIINLRLVDLKNSLSGPLTLKMALLNKNYFPLEPMSESTVASPSPSQVKSSYLLELHQEISFASKLRTKCLYSLRTYALKEWGAFKQWPTTNSAWPEVMAKWFFSTTTRTTAKDLCRLSCSELCTDSVQVKTGFNCWQPLRKVLFTELESVTFHRWSWTRTTPSQFSMCSTWREYLIDFWLVHKTELSDYGTLTTTLSRLDASLKTLILEYIQTALFSLMRLFCLDGPMVRSELLELITANSFGKSITPIRMESQLFACLTTLNSSAQEVWMVRSEFGKLDLENS